MAHQPALAMGGAGIASGDTPRGDVARGDVARELERVRSLVRDERGARMLWARLVEPEDAVVVGAVARMGALEALHRLDPEQELAARLARRLAEVDPGREQGILDALGARVVVPGDDEWPAGVDDNAFPPLCLWVRGPGHLAEACERSVALVGARAATSYGIRVAQDLAAGLAGRGFAVVSGAAYGIDGAAHEGALAVDGTTVAVLAGGIDRPYPSGHTGLLERIAATGLVVSEVAPGSAPTRWRFLSRNRLIATLASATVVVEADLRSGSRNTARHARDTNRVVGAVPGPVTSTVSAGCHELVRSGGAELVTDVAEVVELAGRIGELAPAKRGADRPEDALEPHQRRVLDAGPRRGAVGAEAIATRAGVPVGEVLVVLGVLELDGWCERRDGGWRKR